jgi:hypothetical protein
MGDSGIQKKVTANKTGSMVDAMDIQRYGRTAPTTYTYRIPTLNIRSK